MKKVPKLRFKPTDSGEFPDWEEKYLSDIGVKIIDGDRGSNYPNGDDFLNVGYCLFLNAKNVTKKGFNFQVTSFITEEKDKLLGKGKLERFDIVLTTRGTVGNISFYDNSVPFEHLRINSGMVLIRTDNYIVNSKYLFKYLNSYQIQNEIDKISFGSAQPQLTVGVISKLKIHYPSLPEQEKIAEFLSAVDEKIELRAQKVEKLKTYKKAVMQKLFSQELRFKAEDGSVYPEWEEKTFKDYYEFVPTNSLSREYLTFEENGYHLKNIHYGDIHTKFRVQFDVTKEKVPYINTKLNKCTLCNNGDIIIADASEDYEDIGKSIEIININGESIVAGLHALHAVPKTKEIVVGYMGWFLKCEEMRKKIKYIAQGTKVLSISSKLILDIPIFLPCLAEQKKISDFLSAIDEKIENSEKVLVKLQSWKKGLLQQMFV